MLPDGWHRSTLGEIARITSGGTPDRAEAAYWGGDVPWVTTGEITFNTITDTRERITEAGLKNSSAKLFPAGTLLMAMYGQGKTRGQVAKLGIEAATNQNSAAIMLHEGHDPDFYFHFLASQYEEIRDFGHSGGVSHLNGGILKGVPVPVPPLEEQRSIARMLSTWSAAIVTTERLLANGIHQLGSLKKELLFKAGGSGPEKCTWAEFRLGDVLTEVKRRVDWNDEVEYPLVSVRRRSAGAVHRETLPGHLILTKKLNAVRAGDFLISKMQVVHGAMAMVPSELDGMFASDSYLSFRSADDSRFDLDFIGWLSSTSHMYRAGYRCSYGVHIEKMTFDVEMFLNEKVILPSLASEQRAISDRLNQAAALNAQLERYLNCLKVEKAALMTQLLTGKRRVRTPAAGATS
jgi:type I restriction enzyme S subunit